MDFGFSDEQEMLRAATRRYLEQASPTARVREVASSELGYDPSVVRDGAELGWSGLALPEELGGAGGSIVDLVVIAEELGRLVQPGPFLASTVVALSVAEYGSAAQRAEVLPRMISGETCATWCFAEPGGVWDAEGVTLEGKASGVEIELRGTKRYVQDAQVADWLLVTARVEGVLTQVLVERDTPGIDVVPLSTLDITRRLCDVTFERARVPATAVLGGPGTADVAVERQLQAAAVLLCAESVGGAGRLLELTVQYAKDRVQFGRPIGSFQAIRHKCANMLVWLEASKAATNYAALAHQDRLPDAAHAASIAKSYVGEAFAKLAGEALQIHGGIGFTWEHDVHLYLRRAKSNEVLYGDPAWHRERICRLLDL